MKVVTEAMRKKCSDGKKGNKNPSYVPPLPVKLSSDENEKHFSYLVGYWIGDGLKTQTNLGFAVRNNKIYIDDLVLKASVILDSKLYFRYAEKSCELFFHAETKGLQSRIKEELSKKTIITKHPWEFICGFLDSDGWVSFSDSKKTGITIAFSNTNMDYLLLLGFVLDSVLIPYRIKLTNDYKKGYKHSWHLSIATSAAVYVLANKLLPITIDDKKKEKFLLLIDHFNTLHNNQTIPICETFKGIQGEGKSIGMVQFFVRAATCDMKCKICDSMYSWGKGKKRTLLSLLQECIESNCHSICLTGGEIAQFEDKLSAFIGMLRANDFHIVLQTNGLHYSRSFDMVHTVSMDIKTPCTGEKSNEDLILKLNPKKDEIKTLIFDEDDYEYAIKVNSLAKKIGLPQVLQPCNSVGKDCLTSLIEKYKWICALVLRDRRWSSDIRALPQLHVLIWGNERGR